MRWTVNDIPPQTGKLALITGATGGLGYETARALARAGATVVLTGRNADKGAKALAAIRTEIPDADISYESLDLAQLANVTAFAERFAGSHDRIDILVNNAGLMAPPNRETTGDGFELQFGTNYLSHYALTARLLPLLANAAAPRVVSLSSNAAMMGRIHFEDLQARQGYRPFTSYAQSKLAMLMFAFELQRRSDRAGWGLLSAAAHPGYARTDLISNGPGDKGLTGTLAGLFGKMVSQTAEQGALPQLYAATAPAVAPAGYYGPDGMLGMTGAPKDARVWAQAKDTNTASRLWSVSEQLTGVRFPALAAAA